MKTNRRFLFELLVLVTLFSCARAPQEIEKKTLVPTVPRAPEDVSRSIVRIVSPPENSGAGNGFFVASDKIATNIHLIAGVDPISTHVRGYGGTRSIRGVTAFDVRNNLVILKVSAEGTPLPLGDSDAIEVNDSISAINPFVMKYKDKDSRRTIFGIRDSDKWFLTTLDPDRDASGGPILNGKSEVIGIEVIEGEFGYAIPSNILKMLLAESDTVESLVQWQQRDMIRAYSYVEQAKRTDSNHNRMIEDLNEAIKLNAEFATAYARRGDGKLHLGEFESEQGNATEAQQHYRSAIDDFDKALQLNPEFAAVYKNRAFAKRLLADAEADSDNAAAAQKYYDSAIADYTQVVKQVPNDAASYTDRGTAKSNLGKLEANQGNTVAAQHHYSAAIADYTRSIKLKSDCAKAYYSRGLAKEVLGQQEAAKADLEKAETLKWEQATVRIESRFGIATGFFVDQDKIATNLHVIASGEPIVARSVDEETVWTFEGFTVFDVKNDLVILKIAGKGVPLPLGDSNDVRLGEPVSVVGYPASRYKVAEGTILGLRDRDKWIEVKVEIIGDNGGSPVINSKGEVIGITSATGSLFGYVAPANALKALLERSGPLQRLAQWRERGVMLASMYFQQGISNCEFERYAEAIVDFDGVIRLNPERADTYYNRGLAKFRLGDIESDQGNIEEASKLYASGVEDCTQAIARVPEDTDAYHNRARGKFRLAQSKANRSDIAKVHQDYQDAIQDWTRVIELNSELADPYSSRAAAKAELGKSKADQGNRVEANKLYVSAIEDCTQAIWLNPDFADPYINRGYARFSLGETTADQADIAGAHMLYRTAVQDYTQAIELDSESVYVYKSRGVAKAALGDPEAAIEDFDAAIQIDPDYAEAYYQRGRAKEALGKREEAKADFEKAKTLDPNVEK